MRTTDWKRWNTKRGTETDEVDAAGGESRERENERLLKRQKRGQREEEEMYFSFCQEWPEPWWNTLQDRPPPLSCSSSHLASLSPLLSAHLPAFLSYKASAQREKAEHRSWARVHTDERENKDLLHPSAAVHWSHSSTFRKVTNEDEDSENQGRESY